MKSKTSKTMCLIICLALCMCFSNPVFASAAEANANIQYEADYIENLQSFYASARFKEAYTTLVVSRSTQEVEMNYPSNFGGIYIDNENNLHIQYVETIDTLDDSMQNYEVIYDSVEYGFTYLTSVYSSLIPKMSEFEISVLYVDEFQNKVVVSVDSSFRNAILDYLSKEVDKFDVRCISFTNPIQLKHTDAGGTSVKANGYEFTLGYNAKKTSNGKYGFVTCGHAVLVNDTVKRNKFLGATLGTVKNRQLGGTIDASYVEYSNQSNKTTACMTGDNITGTYSSAQITSGMIVQKYGMTTKAQSGRVTAGSVSLNVGTDSYTDQIQVDIRQEGGDSGAPVVHNFIGPLQQGQIRPNTLLGIATIANSTTWETAYVSKASNINAAFGLSTYILVI